MNKFKKTFWPIDNKKSIKKIDINNDNGVQKWEPDQIIWVAKFFGIIIIFFIIDALFYFILELFAKP